MLQLEILSVCLSCSYILLWAGALGTGQKLCRVALGHGGTILGALPTKGISPWVLEAKGCAGMLC